MKAPIAIPVKERELIGTLTLTKVGGYEGGKGPLVHPYFADMPRLQSAVHMGNDDAFIDAVKCAMWSASADTIQEAHRIDGGWDKSRWSFVLRIEEPNHQYHSRIYHLIGYTSPIKEGEEDSMLLSENLLLFPDRIIVSNEVAYADVHGQGRSELVNEDLAIYSPDRSTFYVTPDVLIRRAIGNAVFNNYAPNRDMPAANIIGIPANSVYVRDLRGNSLRDGLKAILDAAKFASGLPDNPNVDREEMLKEMGRHLETSQLVDFEPLFRWHEESDDFARRGCVSLSELQNLVTLKSINVGAGSPYKSPFETATGLSKEHAIGQIVTNAMSSIMSWYGISELTIMGRLSPTAKVEDMWLEDANIKFFGSGQRLNPGWGHYEEEPTDDRYQAAIIKELTGLRETFGVESLRIDAHVNLFGEARVQVAIDDKGFKSYTQPMWATGATSPYQANHRERANDVDRLFEELITVIEQTQLHGDIDPLSE